MGIDAIVVESIMFYNTMDFHKCSFIFGQYINVLEKVLEVFDVQRIL